MAQRFSLRFLLFVLLAAVANFGGYAYAHLARTISGNPFFAREVQSDPLWPSYWSYVQRIFQGSFADVAVYQEDFFLILGRATVASAGLLTLALAISVVLGLAIGLLGVRLHPPGIRGWLTGLTIFGLSTPSFFVGRLAVAFLLLFTIYSRRGQLPLPLQGYGWDAHLVLPLLALAVRPTAQIAQVVAGLLAGELGRQYIVAARGKGLSESRVIAHHAMRNVWAPTAHSIAGAVRLLVADLIVVEWLFAWPGLGYLMAGTLIPAQFASAAVEARFLDPPLVASLVTIFAAVFLFTDMIAGGVAHLADPRQRI
jgi:ABC-type dipeptide/oligopeptide/nickel transport system permease component